MSNAVSALGIFVNSVDLMRSAQAQMQQLAQENATGTKSTSLEGYGEAAPMILNLQTAIAESRSWVANSTQVATYLTGYNTTLGQLSSDATQLQSALTSLSNPNATTLQTLQTLVQGLETDVSATLNTQVGDRYIFAGSRYSTAPTVDITTLPVPATPQPIALASGSTTPPTIPDYDTDYASTSPPGVVASGAPYYNQQQVNIAQGDTISYGVSADDPSIQQLVYALKQAEAGVASGSATTAAQFFDNAKSAITTALSGLSTLTQQNSANQTAVQNSQTVENQSIATMQDQLGNLTQVDAATVATQLTTLENQLSGTYKATSTLLGLTILTYLPT
jgi:flagellar hook-associated protein 3 FlgL